MTFFETLLFLAKWVHGIAAVTWVGGSIFYFIVLTPFLSKGEINGVLSKNISRGFGNLVRWCIAVLVITGPIIMLNSLTSPHMNSQYIVTLSIKISLSMGMFYLAWRQGRKRVFRGFASEHESPGKSQPADAGGFRLVSHIPKIILGLGVITFLLSDLLAIIFLQSSMAN